MIAEFIKKWEEGLNTVLAFGAGRERVNFDSSKIEFFGVVYI